jgi:D-alanyl-D-alanine carboxypeptidase
MKPGADGVTRRIDALVAAMTGSGGPGAAVAVVRGGQVAYRGCFGLADVEWRQAVAPDTVFALASLSKPFTAMTVMLLSLDGLIDIDAPVSAYLPAYPGPGRVALVRHLLTHTSGIPNFLTLPGFRERAAHLDHTPGELIEVFAGLPLDFEPGSRYGYSNSGYRLLDIITETVTGMPFAEVLTERLFGPAGMTSARLLTDRAVIPWRARGYEVSGDSGIAAAPHLSMSITGGAGGLAASLEDMVAFDQTLRDYRLIGPDLEQQMLTPVRLSSGRTEGYGLGWVLTSYRGTPVASHAGGVDGFSSFYARLPDCDTSIIILANRDGFPCYHLARKVTDEIASMPGPAETAPVPGGIPAALAGTYRDTLASMHVTADGGRLVVEHAGITRTMIPAGPASFTDQNDPDIRLHVHAADGNADAITINFPFTWFTGYKTEDSAGS